MAGVAAEEVLAGVRSVIAGLTLTGLSSANVVAMLVGDDEEGNGPNVPGFPCVICCYEGGEAVDPSAGTNLRDDVVYPVSVVILSSENRSNTNRERNLKWRQQIRRAFHHQRLSGVTAGHAWKCEVRPGAIADRPRWLQNQHAQVLVVAVTVREPRT